jgi:hypothetical protein
VGQVSVPQPYAEVTTDAQGYYAIGDLPNGRYLVGPDDAEYSFGNLKWVDIPQAEVQPYDFTATFLHIVATWTGLDLEASLTFYNDGRFEAGLTHTQINGTYTISGNQITFLDGGCRTIEGTYAYSINENILTLVNVNDTCERNLILSGSWDKQ